MGYRGGVEKNRKKALRRERGRKFVRSLVVVFADRKRKKHHGMSGDRASFPDQISLSAFVFARAENNRPLFYCAVPWALSLPSLATQSTIQPWAQGEKKTQKGEGR